MQFKNFLLTPCSAWQCIKASLKQKICLLLKLNFFGFNLLTYNKRKHFKHNSWFYNYSIVVIIHSTSFAIHFFITRKIRKPNSDNYTVSKLVGIGKVLVNSIKLKSFSIIENIFLANIQLSKIKLRRHSKL